VSLAAVLAAACFDHPIDPAPHVRYAMLRRGVVHMEYLDDERLKGVENTPVALRRAVERQRKSRELFKDWCVCVLVKAQ